MCIFEAIFTIILEVTTITSQNNYVDLKLFLRQNAKNAR